MIRNTVITGIGIISPRGLGIESLSANRNASIAEETHRGRIPDFNELDYMDSKSAKYGQRVEKLALASSRLALTDANLEPSTLPDMKFGVALGSMTSNLRAAAIFDQLALRGEAGFCDPSLIPSGIMNSLSGIVSIKNGIRAFHVPVAAGEASGAQAIQFALMHIDTGRIDAALAGSVEEICEEFHLTDCVKNSPCNAQKRQPDNNHQSGKGSVYPLSEAAAVLVLESASSAAQRGATVYAECIGFGSSYGTSDRKTALRAAIKALEQTFRNPDTDPFNTDLIFASLNGCQTNNFIEKEALSQFFGSRLPEITSINSLVGDALGASGALQVAAAALDIKSSMTANQFKYSDANFKTASAQVGCETKKLRQILLSSFSDHRHMSFLALREVYV